MRADELQVLFEQGLVEDILLDTGIAYLQVAFPGSAVFPGEVAVREARSLIGRQRIEEIGLVGVAGDAAIAKVLEHARQAMRRGAAEDVEFHTREALEGWHPAQHFELRLGGGASEHR